MADTPSRRRLSLIVVVLALLGVVGLSAVAGGEETANFEVELTVPDGVDAGEDLSVTATVTNTGNVDGTQTIELTDGDGTVLETATVTLDAGESTEQELTWEGVPGDERTVTPTVHSENDVDTAVVTVRWSFFELSDLDPVEQTIEHDGTLSTAVTVSNTGTEADQQEVSLLVADEAVQTETVTLDSEAVTRLTFEAVDPGLEPGEYTYTVESADDRATEGTLLIEEEPEPEPDPEPAEFVVDIVESTAEDGTATVVAEVTNEGEREATQSVTFAVDGTERETRDVTLAGGEQTQETFTHDPPAFPVDVTVTTELPDVDTVRIHGASVEEGPAIETVSPEFVEAGDEITVTYTAAGPHVADVRVRVENASGASVFEKSVEPGVETEFTFDQHELSFFEAGSYDVSLVVEDEFGETGVARLADAFSAEASIDWLGIYEAQPELVQTDESLTVIYAANGTNVAEVRLFADGPDGEVALAATVEEGIREEHTFEREALQELIPGPYDLRVEIEDHFGGVTTDTAEDAFQIGTIHDPDAANFGEVTYEGVAGDFVTVDVTLSDVDEAYILVGGDRPSDERRTADNPLDVLHVEGSTTFIINTRLLGTDRPSEAVYIPTTGTVTSYAHDLGPDAEPTGVFSDLRFENETYHEVAETLTEFRGNASVSPQRRPLHPGRISLVVGETDSLVVREDGLSDPRYPFDRASIELTEPELGELRTYLVPEGNADDLEHQADPDDLEPLDMSDLDTIREMAIETDTISLGDRLLVEVEATGLWGALVDATRDPDVLTHEDTDLITPAEFREFLDRPEGISLTAVHENPRPNVAGTRVDLFESDVSDVSILTDPPPGVWLADDPGTLYLLVDTRAPGPFHPLLAGGEEFSLEFAYESEPGRAYTFAETGLDINPAPFDPAGPEQYPYFEANATSEVRTASFEVVERTVEYDRTDLAGRPVVLNSTDQSITGTTTLPPVADPVDIVLDFRHEPRTVEIEDVHIDANGTFEIQHDFSAVTPADEIELQFWYYEQQVDDRNLRVLDSEDDFSVFEVTDLSTTAGFTDEPVADIAATIMNFGTLTETNSVELLVDGVVTETQNVTLDPFESTVVRFEETATALEPGSHPLEVRTPDDTQTELLILAEPTANFTIDSLSANSTIEDGERSTTASATINNTGQIAGAVSVEFSIDGEVVTTEEINISAGADRVFRFDSAVEDLDPGEYTLTVTTQNDTASEDLVVEETLSVVEISALDVDSPVPSGSQTQVSVTAVNTGNVPANDTVDLLLEGDLVEERALDIDAGENVTFTVAVPIEGDPGEYVLTAESADDAANEIVLVTEPDEDDPPEEDDDGLFGVVVDRRAAVGGTVIVGAIYLLGSWV